MAIGPGPETSIPPREVTGVRVRARTAPEPIDEGAIYGVAVALGALVGALLGLASTGAFG